MSTKRKCFQHALADIDYLTLPNLNCDDVSMRTSKLCDENFDSPWLDLQIKLENSFSDYA